MKDKLCEVAYHHPLEADYHRIGLKTDWEGFVPGQFGMLEVPREDGVLLRRPFSFAFQSKGVTEILYKRVGRGTSALSRVRRGESLRLLGPLGKGFTVGEGPLRAVGVAGGYGVAPFVELAAQLRQRGEVLTLFYGARSRQDLHYIKEFSDLHTQLYISTLDGSVGYRGLITELLEQTYLEKQAPEKIWSCGPMGLLKSVQDWSASRGVDCELSVEETMGCGTGVCLGCVVQDLQGHYRRACIEGPVFCGSSIRI